MTSSVVFRVVLDTNVIIAALKSRNPQSPTVELLTRWANREFLLLFSDDLLAEYIEKMIARAIPVAVRERMIANIIRHGELIDVLDRQIQRVITADPDDDLVIACATVGKATHLVTYDPHILDVAAQFESFSILSGLDFLQAIRGERSTL